MNDTTSLDRFTEYVICFGLGFIIALFVVYDPKENKTEVPKDETTRIDSLIKVNDSIKIKIDELDSIKNAKVIEVSTLDNDSTLKLFYELVSE